MALLPSRFDRVVAIANAKGGVFKTTIASNISALIARPDYRVLVVDLDGQGNLGLDLGYRDADENDEGRSLAGALAGYTEPSDVALMSNVRPGLDVIPGGQFLHRSSPALAADPYAALRLRAVLEPIIDDYELVVLDLPPGDRGTRIAAFGASRYVLAPTKSDLASAEGVMEIIRTMRELQTVGEKHNESIELIGVVHVDSASGATQIQRTTRRQVLQEIDLVDSPEIMFKTVVRHLEKAAQQARLKGVTFDELSSKAKDAPKFWEILQGKAKPEDAIPGTASAGAEDMRSVASELIARITKAEMVQ